MIKEAVAQGATVEEAFNRACAELGVDPTEATCEVLELPVKKTFGLFGGKPAKARAYIEIPDPEPVPAAPAVPETPAARENKQPEKADKAEKAEKAAAKQSETPAAKPSKRAEGVDPAEEAAAYLKRVLGAMGLNDVEVSVEKDDNGAALNLSGGDISFIIGHRGETLDALQYLASLVANHVGEAYYRVTLDVGNYREKRKTTLEALGRRMAIRAVRSGRNAALEPMNPYERRVIHTAVHTIEGATSWSEGEAQNRHVVIGPEGGERRQRRDNRGKGGYNRGGARPRSTTAAPKPNPTPRADDPTAPIYGKIEVKK